MTFTGNVLQSLTVLSWVGPVSAATLRVHRRAASGASLRAEDTEVRQMRKLRKNILFAWSPVDVWIQTCAWAGVLRQELY